MTKTEAVAAAKDLPEEANYGHASELSALRLLARYASKQVKDAVILELLARAEGMRNPATPGHAVHFDDQVRAAAWAVENLA